MCISDVNIPNKNKSPLGIIKQVSPAINSKGKIPIGIYFLFSDETLGINI